MKKTINCKIKWSYLGYNYRSENKLVICGDAVRQYFDTRSYEVSPEKIEVIFRTDNPDNFFIKVYHVNKDPDTTGGNVKVKFPEDKVGEFSTDKGRFEYSFSYLHALLRDFYEDIGEVPFYVEMKVVK